LLVAALNPGVAVRAFDDLVGNEIRILFGDRIVCRAANEALHGVIGVRRVGDGLARGLDADQALAAIGKGDNRRCSVRAFGVDDDFGLSAFHHGDARVRRAQVDANNFAHSVVLVPFSAARFRLVDPYPGVREARVLYLQTSG
jgi:NAD-specific glutamate dehydrogenase